MKATDLRNSRDEKVDSAPHAQETISIYCEQFIPKNSMIRKKVK